jgi:hypothetical protein
MGWRLGIELSACKTVMLTFFTAVINVDISSISGRGDQITDGLFITTDKDILNELMTPHTIRAIGELEYDFLRDAPAIVYSRKEAPPEFEWFEYLHACLRQVKLFFNVMWLAKDNAADSELAFLSYPSGLTQMTHSSSVSTMYSMADGSRTSVSFSRKELQAVRAYYRAWVREVVDPRSYGMLEPDDLSRTMRAFYWIQAGRSASGIGERIACFCTAMESLLATTSSELAHQLAERMALFLSADAVERTEIYRQVKRLYKIRSKVVHGDVLRQAKRDEFVEASLECDELVRRAIQRAAHDRDAQAALARGNEELDKYFLRLLFGSQRDQPIAVSASEAGGRI